MKITSSKDRTVHLLTRITPYVLFGEEEELSSLGFLYFEITPAIEKEIKSFLAGDRKEAHYIQMSACILIEESLIENANNSDLKEYKFIKFDATNYLEQEPFVEDTDYIKRTNGTIMCLKDHLRIVVEILYEGSLCPNVVYIRVEYYDKFINLEE